MYCKDMVCNDYWDVVVDLMDDEKREQVHLELAPCTNEEFLNRYLELDSNFLCILNSEF